MELHTIYTPLSSERISSFSCSRSPALLKTGKSGACNSNRVKAVAERRDNLDHLQRANLQQPKRAPQVSSTGLWDRFPAARTVQQMMDTMERMMEDPFAHNSTWPSAAEGVRNGYSRGRAPRAIKERENDYKMRFDMPGMTKDDVKVWVEENMLVVKAEKVPRSRDGQEYVNEGVAEEGWSAKSYGKYSTRIALPETIEFEKINAEVKDGVLYITVPKASTSSKIIDIDVR